MPPVAARGGRFHCRCSQPGRDRHPDLSKFGASDDAIAAQRQAIAAKIPLGRLGTAREIAETVAFLASGGTAYLTGQDIVVVDGAGQVVQLQLVFRGARRPGSRDARGRRERLEHHWFLGALAADLGVVDDEQHAADRQLVTVQAQLAENRVTHVRRATLERAVERGEIVDEVWLPLLRR
jgi:hypothetical protein